MAERGVLLGQYTFHSNFKHNVMTCTVAPQRLLTKELSEDSTYLFSRCSGNWKPGVPTLIVAVRRSVLWSWPLPNQSLPGTHEMCDPQPKQKRIAVVTRRTCSGKYVAVEGTPMLVYFCKHLTYFEVSFCSRIWESLLQQHWSPSRHLCTLN